MKASRGRVNFYLAIANLTRAFENQNLPSTLAMGRAVVWLGLRLPQIHCVRELSWCYVGLIAPKA